MEISFDTTVGSVAQSVEQRTENPCVGGSIPSRATIFLQFQAPSKVIESGSSLGFSPITGTSFPHFRSDDANSCKDWTRHLILKKISSSFYSFFVSI